MASNLESSVRLQERLAAATKPPLAQPPPKMPLTAAQISGRSFLLLGNSLNLKKISLEFDMPSPAWVIEAIRQVVQAARMLTWPTSP
jgi:hypothetical protein